MLNRLLVIAMLVVFGTAMYLAGLYSPDSIRETVEKQFSGPPTSEQSGDSD